MSFCNILIFFQIFFVLKAASGVMNGKNKNVTSRTGRKNDSRGRNTFAVGNDLENEEKKFSSWNENLYSENPQQHGDAMNFTGLHSGFQFNQCNIPKFSRHSIYHPNYSVRDRNSQTFFRHGSGEDFFFSHQTFKINNQAATSTQIDYKSQPVFGARSNQIRQQNIGVPCYQNTIESSVRGETDLPGQTRNLTSAPSQDVQKEYYPQSECDPYDHRACSINHSDSGPFNEVNPQCSIQTTMHDQTHWSQNNLRPQENHQNVFSQEQLSIINQPNPKITHHRGLIHKSGNVMRSVSYVKPQRSDPKKDSVVQSDKNFKKPVYYKNRDKAIQISILNKDIAQNDLERARNEDKNQFSNVNDKKVIKLLPIDGNLSFCCRKCNNLHTFKYKIRCPKFIIIESLVPIGDLGPIDITRYSPGIHIFGFYCVDCGREHKTEYEFICEFDKFVPKSKNSDDIKPDISLIRLR